MQASNDYQVAPPYEAVWNVSRQLYYCCVLPVFGTDEMLVPPECFSDVLQPGTIIEVVFTLKHWPFFEKGVPKNDTFGAHLEMINILKNAPPPIQSPYRARARRSLHIPQTPSTPSRVNLNVLPLPFSPIRWNNLFLPLAQVLRADPRER